jgi:uncharacterized membrane protein HdeD (DUF308 family)
MSATSPAPVHDRVERVLAAAASARWRWRAAEGAGLVLLGFVALLMARWTGPAIAPAMLALAGAVSLLAAWRAQRGPGAAPSFLLALAGPLAGAVLLRNPPAAMLAPVLAAAFAWRGAGAILLAAAYRRHGLKEWEWVAVSGVVSLILVMLLLAGLPGPYLWMLGLLVGVDLIFHGCAALALVWAAAEALQGAAMPAAVPAQASAAPRRAADEAGVLPALKALPSR